MAAAAAQVYQEKFCRQRQRQRFLRKTLAAAAAAAGSIFCVKMYVGNGIGSGSGKSVNENSVGSGSSSGSGSGRNIQGKHLAAVLCVVEVLVVKLQRLLQCALRQICQVISEYDGGVIVVQIADRKRRWGAALSRSNADGRIGCGDGEICRRFRSCLSSFLLVVAGNPASKE